MADSIAEALYTHLRGTTTIKGANRASEVYYRRASTGAAMPYVTFFAVDGDNLSDAYDAGNKGTNTAQPLFQFDVWGTDRYKNSNIADAIIARLNRYSTAMGGINVINIQCRGPRELYEGDYSNVFHDMVEAEIEYERL